MTWRARFSGNTFAHTRTFIPGRAPDFTQNPEFP